MKCHLPGILIIYLYLYSVVSLKIAAPSSSMKHSVEAMIHFCNLQCIEINVTYLRICTYINISTLTLTLKQINKVLVEIDCLVPDFDHFLGFSLLEIGFFLLS